MHRIVKNGHPRAEDFLNVDLPAQRGNVILEDLFFGNRSSIARSALAERLTDRPVHFGQCRAAIPGLELDTVVLRRIVAGGDHDAAEKFAVGRGEGNRLRWRGRLRQDHTESGALQSLGGNNGEIAREESAVVSHDERIAIDAVRRRQTTRSDGNRFGHLANVIECECVGDDSAPAVGAESDVGHACTLLTKDTA